MKHLSLCLAIGLFFVSISSYADIDSNDLFDTVLGKYEAVASTWAEEITARATTLFWSLAAISMVWTFGFMALKQADLGEFFAELVRFTVFTGFFLWLLTNGPEYADLIIKSMRQMATNATNTADTGGSSALTPSGIVDIGFILLGGVLNEASLLSPAKSLFGLILGLIVLALLTLIAVNMLLLLISGWILAYAGIFYLGFGGSRWTSDIAINYFKAVLGLGMELFTMILLIGIGQSVLFEYFNDMTPGPPEYGEMFIIFVIALILYMLTNKLPALVSGVINGFNPGGGGIGSFGAGAALGAAGTLGTAISMGGAAVSSTAANVMGAGSAVTAAIKYAQSDDPMAPSSSFSEHMTQPPLLSPSAAAARFDEAPSTVMNNTEDTSVAAETTAPGSDNNSERSQS